MNRISAALLELKQLEQMAEGESAIHRLHPSAKVLTTCAFLVCVVSCQRYELAALLPFFLFPVVLIASSALPFTFILRKIVLFLPFMLFVGIFNPLFDRAPLLQIGSWAVSGGWISFMSIVLRSTLTVTAALVLIGTTGFSAICRVLGRWGAPQVFTTQLLFLYRYIFVLAEEAARASSARELRSCGTQGQGIGSYASLTGGLLLRTWGRAERIHAAMLARGFNGEFHSRQHTGVSRADLGFVCGWTTLFIVFRFYNIPYVLEQIIAGILP